MFLSVTALAAAALSVAGCSGGSVDPIKPTNSPTKTSSPTNTPSPTSPAGGDLSGACAKVAPASGSALPVCTALYTDGTALRLPKGTSGQSYGGFTRAGTGFATADGTTLHVEDDVRQKAAASDSAGYADYGSTVYRATVSGHQVTALTPVLRIDRDALVRSVFAGTTMVGKIAPVDLHADAAEPSYSGEPSLPVVINWSDASSDGQLTVSSPTPPCPSPRAARARRR